MLVVEPQECDRKWCRGWQQMFVDAISLPYLSLDAIAVYGVVKEPLWNRDKHLGAFGFSIYHS